jgi:hypothetical protein
VTTLHPLASNEYSLVFGTANRVIGTGALSTAALSTAFSCRPPPGHRWTTGRPGSGPDGSPGRPVIRAGACEEQLSDDDLPGSSDASKLALRNDLTAVRQISEEL